MTHTKYLALLRYITKIIQSASTGLTINQWDFNYNSRTFDQLKVYGDIKPFPKGIINLSSIEKISAHSNVFTYDNLMRGVEINSILDSIDIAEVYKKYKIYGLLEWYRLAVDITLYLETGIQLLDFVTAWNAKFPVNKITENNEYDYFVQLPKAVLKDFDPEKDMGYNIYVSKSDDASNYNYFSRVIATPLIKPSAISESQDKKNENHSININLEITDFVLSNLVSVDVRRWKRAFFIDFKIAIQDSALQIEELKNSENMLPENQRGSEATIYDAYKPLKMIIPADYSNPKDWSALIDFIKDNNDITIYVVLKNPEHKTSIQKAGAQALLYVDETAQKAAQNIVANNLDWDGFLVSVDIIDYIKELGSYFVVYRNDSYTDGCDAVLFLETDYDNLNSWDKDAPEHGASIVYNCNTSEKFHIAMELMKSMKAEYIYLDSNKKNDYEAISQWLVNYKTYSLYGFKRENKFYPEKVNYDNDKD